LTRTALLAAARGEERYQHLNLSSSDEEALTIWTRDRGEP
jgi:hypothetical protein